jgi:hypothetical protein
MDDWPTSHPLDFETLGYQDTEICPRCGEPELHSIHVVTCSSPHAVLKWEKFLTSLEAWFIKSHTLPDIRVGLLHHLRQWYTGTVCAPYHCRYVTAQERFDAQNGIGWTPFFLGLMHPSWAIIQQDYYAELGKRNTGKRWLTQLLRKFWRVSWDLWTHRRSVLLSADSCVTYQEHLSADSAVTTAWEACTANPLPALRR